MRLEIGVLAGQQVASLTRLRILQATLKTSQFFQHFLRVSDCIAGLRERIRGLQSHPAEPNEHQKTN